MHELSVSEAIIATVVRHAEGRRVLAVSLRVGHLRQVVPDSLKFYFELLSRGTVCEGARLDHVAIPASLRCESCNHQWNIDIPAFRCPQCAGSDVTVTAGNELEVESIEVDHEAPCAA